MADTVKATLIGKDKVKVAFGVLDLRAKAAFRRIINECSMELQRGAKERCPVRKLKGLGGRLRGSIAIKFYNNGLTGEVGTNVEYAPFVEFGTGRRGASSSHGPLPAGYSYGPKAGMSAQPFMYPAFEEVHWKFIRRVQEEVGNGFGI